MLLFFLLVPAVFATSTNPEPVLRSDRQIIQESVQNTASYPNDEKVKDLAIKVESLLSSAIIKPEYENEYLKNTDIPPYMRENFKARYKNFKEINKIKDLGRAKEGELGYLEPLETASTEERDKIKAENSLREQLYGLICSNLNIVDEKEKTRVPVLYRDIILNIKSYSFSSPSTERFKPVNDKVISSIATSYKYKMVYETLFKLLGELKFDFDSKLQKKFDGSIPVNYKCSGSDQRTFTVKVCQIKSGKLFECKDSADDALYSTIEDGSMVWIEKGPDKNKTLVMPDTRSEEQEIKLCPSDTEDFGLLEKISNKLIAEEEAAKIKAKEEEERKKKEALEKAKKKAKKAKKEKDKKSKSKKKKK